MTEFSLVFFIISFISFSIANWTTTRNISAFRYKDRSDVDKVAFRIDVFETKKKSRNIKDESTTFHLFGSIDFFMSRETIPGRISWWSIINISSIENMVYISRVMYLLLLSCPV